MQSARHHPDLVRRAKAFTLIELMIAIGLSLLLLLGINAVFRISAQTVGMGMAQSLVSRDLRSAQTTLEYDMGNLYATPYDALPAIIIQSMNQVAFRDAIDERSDPVYANQGTIDAAQEAALAVDNGTGTFVYPPRLGGGSNNTPGPSILLNNRNHRVDIFSFFVNGFYRRQTSDPNQKTYQSSQSSNQAYIWYGHLRQPGLNPAPGTAWSTPSTYLPLGIADSGGTTITAANNPENGYASKWILGRRVILLVPPDNNNHIPDPDNSANSAGQDYYPKVKPPNNQENLTPLSYGNKSALSGFAIDDSEYDLAGTNLAQFQGYVQQVIFGPTKCVAPALWYLPLLTSFDLYSNSAQNNAKTLRPRSAFRYCGKPWISKSANAGPMSFEEAMTAPLFIRGCSQFTVEFAGDYLTQNDVVLPTGGTATVKPPGQGSATDLGVATKAESDGVLDFDVVVTEKSPGVYIPSKKVRWYGMTRSLDGRPDEIPKANWIPDPNLVHPVWWHLQTTSTAVAAASKALPFEKTNKIAPNDNGFPQSRPKDIDAYTCAWSPYELNKLNDPLKSNPNDALFGKAYPSGFMPWMVRITMRVDDPNGRLAEGQTVEWIFNMPRVR